VTRVKDGCVASLALLLSFLSPYCSTTGGTGENKFGNSRLIYEEDMKKRVKFSRPEEAQTHGRWNGNYLGTSNPQLV
jgi:hypothetical protein